jgi:hypothetical protein
LKAIDNFHLQKLIALEPPPSMPVVAWPSFTTSAAQKSAVAEKALLHENMTARKSKVDSEVASHSKIEIEFSEENIIALISARDKGRIVAKEFVKIFAADAMRKHGNTFKDV